MDEKLCKVCSANMGKYVCPRCNLLYCSLKCYQSRLHIRCSEEFYKENVFESMSMNSNDPQDVDTMKDILHRMYDNDHTEEDSGDDEDELDSDDETDISERLKSVCLDDAEAIWEKLSESEKQEFHNFVQEGCPESVIPVWEPWWSFSEPKQKIEEVTNSKHDSFEYVTNCPVLKNVPLLSDITTRPPASCVVWNVVNVMAAYSYMLRYFNGEPMDFIVEAVSLLISISGNLQSNDNYESYENAVEEVAYAIVECSWLDRSEHTLSRMKEDVQKILHGPEESNKSFYLQAALSDILTLMEKAKSSSKKYDFNPPEKQTSFSKQFQVSSGNQFVQKEKLKTCIKKIEYFLSWVKSCSLGISP